MSWYRVNVVGDGVASIRIFDGIGFGGDVADLIEEIEGAKVIELWIDSTGGCGRATEELWESIEGRCRMATVTGNAHSSAALLLQAAEHRRIVTGGQLMLHSPSAHLFDNSEGFRRQAAWLDAVTARWIDRLCDRGAPVEDVCRWMSGPDVFMDARTAIDSCLCDEIWTPPPRRRASECSESSSSSEDAPLSLSGEIANEDFFFEIVKAFGPIRSSDKKRFYRNLQAHFGTNLREIDP